MSWKNIRLIFLREMRDQLRDRRTLFMITILPVLLYPMLGLGVVEMMLTFSQQRRTVVILNADQLPDRPSLLDAGGFDPKWYPDDENDASLLRVVTDLSDSETAEAGSPDEGGPSSEIARSGVTDSERSGLRPGEVRDRELLASARLLRELIQRHAELFMDRTAPGQSERGPGAESTTEDQATAAVLTPDLTETALRTRINELFMASGIQVLLIVPDGYRQTLNEMHERLARRGDPSLGTHPDTGSAAAGPVRHVPALMAVRNGADDKSMMAFVRVQTAIESWEDAIRTAGFQAASVPEELHRPAQLNLIELAQSKQVAASVWSKLFPALLVIMSLTGAFYAAIDLGAGEKERGTMETLLVSPARRIEVVLGKYFTIMVFSIFTALLNLLSMGLTGQQMASLMGNGVTSSVSLEFPGLSSLLWLVALLFPLAALFSALCLALATFAKSTKEGQYYLTPLLMVVMGMTLFCLSPAVEMTPLYSVLPVINVALLLKGLLLGSAQTGLSMVYAIPVLISSLGYSMLALWWAIELFNSEDVLFREAEKFDVRLWVRHLLRTKDAVPAMPEAVFCFVLILILQFVAMSSLQPDLSSPNAGNEILRSLVIQQLVMIACPAVFMGVLLTTSLRATFRLRRPSLSAMAIGIGLAFVAHPLSFELSQFLVNHQVFPPLPDGAQRVMALIRTDDQPLFLLIAVFAVTPAICEELAFRGFILSGLARGGRLAIATVISSMMFGIIHMIPQQAFNAALLGLVLGVLAVYSRSLFPAMAFHFVNNTIATLHAGGLSWIVPDGVFFSRDAEQSLRYEAPLLVLCLITGALMMIHMIQMVIREQDLKRRGIIPPFSEPAAEAISSVREANAVPSA